MLWVFLILFSAHLFAQNTIPAGTILPVALNSSLNSRKVKVGQVITARVMQDVPLPHGTIHAGSKVIGHVTHVKPADARSAAQLSLRFDTLIASKRRVPHLRDWSIFYGRKSCRRPKTIALLSSHGDDALLRSDNACYFVSWRRGLCFAETDRIMSFPLPVVGNDALD